MMTGKLNRYFPMGETAGNPWVVIIELLDTLVSCLVAGKGELKGVNCWKICFVQLKTGFLIQFWRTRRWEKQQVTLEWWLSSFLICWSVVWLLERASWRESIARKYVLYSWKTGFLIQFWRTRSKWIAWRVQTRCPLFREVIRIDFLKISRSC